ncbi:MAG: hypothetical protein ACRC7S_18665 [Cetobacterium sp.]
MGLEYYYLFGLDIPLDRHNLGVIKQPKLIDYINNKSEVEMFYLPFVMNDIIINQSEDNEVLNELKKKIGSLTFMLMNCYQSSRFDVLMSLINSLSLLYRCESKINEDFSISVGDVRIDDSNFDILSDLVLEMSKIDKSKIKFNKVSKKEMTEIEKEFERRRKKYLEQSKNKKRDNELNILDISNIIIHGTKFSYEDVLNMTVYQIKNTFNAMNSKEGYEVGTLYRVSPKFEANKESLNHWSEKVKIDKSGLSQID